MDPVLPDETSSDPNRDPDDLNGVIDTGTTGPVTFQPIVWEFIDVPSGWWFDPLPTDGFLYDMTGGSLFTDILDFPSGFSDPFDVWAEGSLLGSFGPGDSVDFVTTLGHGVSAFAIHGINPLVDPTDPLAFPLQLAFDTPTADFQMQGFTTDSAAAVPEPSALILALVGLLSLGMRRRR